MTEPRRYTAEVEAAMRSQGLLPDEPEKPPGGYLRYHFAVEATLLNGVAPTATVVTILRGLADQLETGEQHG